MEMTRMAVLLFLGVMAGCSTMPILAPPIEDARENVPRARLRVISAQSGTTRGFPGNDCCDEDLPGFGHITTAHSTLSSRNGRSLGMPDPERISNGHFFAEIYIEAEKPFTLEYSLLGVYTCSVAGTFVPQEDKDYEIRAQTTAGGCILLLSTLAEDALWVPMPMARATTCKLKWKMSPIEWLQWNIRGTRPAPKE